MPFPPASPENFPEDANLLKAVLPPLLDDFQHWFGRTLELLEKEDLYFLTPERKQDLTDRVKDAQKQVSVSRALSTATDSQAGIDMPVMMIWHKLVHECWGVALRYRKEQGRPIPFQNIDDESSNHR